MWIRLAGVGSHILGRFPDMSQISYRETCELVICVSFASQRYRSRKLLMEVRRRVRQNSTKKGSDEHRIVDRKAPKPAENSGKEKQATTSSEDSEMVTQVDGDLIIPSDYSVVCLNDMTNNAGTSDRHVYSKELTSNYSTKCNAVIRKDSEIVFPVRNSPCMKDKHKGNIYVNSNVSIQPCISNAESKKSDGKIGQEFREKRQDVVYDLVCRSETLLP